ncbi:MAG: aldo/keto reductase [Ktedonobacterales bacterium]|nr:aldo/keto reductase [Ktedonobacterales bacterium]
MEMRTLGRTAIPVSLVSLGAASLADLYTAISDEQAVATVHAALAAGITCIDTAPFYGSGLSERRLGLALRTVPRADYVLATKVGRVITPQGEAVFDMTRDGVLRSIDASLARLGIDAIDIAHIHDPDDFERAALDEVFPTLAELRAQGIIRAISAGMNQWEMLDRFLAHADFDAFMLAGRYTLLEHAASVAFLDRCAARGVGIMLAGVFNSGILATGACPGAKYNYADAPLVVLEQVRQIEAICARHQVGLATAALQFPLAHPAIDTLVLGMSTADTVTVNLSALAAPVPDACWQELRQAHLIAPDVPLPSSSPNHG